MDPLDATGGGVCDVAAFALRVACLMLSQPPKRRLLVADEPFRFVSEEYRPAVRQMIETLADELGIQFILVTHATEFEIGKVVRL
jgi:ABC-type Fe3+/spermidine/putrescine transport system ATPase subunit